MFKCLHCGTKLPDDVMQRPMRIVPEDWEYCAKGSGNPSRHFPVPASGKVGTAADR